MTHRTVTSRELNQNVGRAKKAANSGPVFIADRGRPAHVPLSIQECQRLAGQRRSLTEALSMRRDIQRDIFIAHCHLRLSKEK